MYKILLVDDEGIVLDSLQFIITRNFGESCEIRRAKTGRQGIEIAQEFVPDIAFMDIQMPGIKGIDAIREIRTFNKKCQFIIMSAYDRFTFAQEAINLGVIEYLTKPASRSAIVAALEKAMTVIDRERASRSQNLIIREKLETVVPIIENSFLNLLLFQDDPSVSLDRYLELLNLQTKYGWIMALQFGDAGENGIPENPVGSTVQVQNQHLMLREIVREFFPSGIVGPILSGTVPVFLPHEAGELSYEQRIAVIETARNMVRQLRQKLRLHFRAGISNVHSLTEQDKSWEEAKKSLRIDQSSVVHLRDTKMELEYEPDYPVDLEQKIFSSLAKLDTDSVIHYSSLFFDWMAENYGNYVQCIRLKILEFAMWAERDVSLREDFETYGFLYRKDWLDTVLNCQTLEEMRRWFLGKMGNASSCVHKVREQKEMTVVGKALQYIQQHFCRDLSLEDVSRYVDVSPYYFSKLFKEETGQTYVEYLTGLRVEKAKQMLSAASPASIKEVCLAVGYSDPNYFSRIFKKTTGQTPTEYRDQA